jgi:hypothetical protein
MTFSSGEVLMTSLMTSIALIRIARTLGESASDRAISGFPGYGRDKSNFPVFAVGKCEAEIAQIQAQR